MRNPERERRADFHSRAASHSDRWRRLGFVEIGQDPQGSSGNRCARPRSGVTRRVVSIEQPDAEPRLERLHVLAHHAGEMRKVPRRAGEARTFDDFDEYRHRRVSIHRLTVTRD